MDTFTFLSPVEILHKNIYYIAYRNTLYLLFLWTLLYFYRWLNAPVPRICGTYFGGEAHAKKGTTSEGGMPPIVSTYIGGPTHGGISYTISPVGMSL